MAKVTLSDSDIFRYSLGRIWTYKLEIRRCKNRIARHIDGINKELKQIDDYVRYIEESHKHISGLEEME